MATTTNMGTNVEILNLVLTTGADSEIRPTNKTNNVLIRNRGDGDIYYRVEQNASEYFTIPFGQSLTVELGARSNNAGWLRAETGGVIAEIISMYGSE